MTKLLFLLFASLFISRSVFAGNTDGSLKSHYRLIVSGAGPGGLSAAQSAIAAGVPPEEILVIEKRARSGERSHGSRGRIVVIDRDSGEVMQNNDVRLPGARFVEMVMHKQNGDRRFMPNVGSWKNAVESLFGGRSLDWLSSIGEVERRHVEAFERAGGQIIFEDTISIQKKGTKTVIILGGQEISADLIVAAEGANSLLAQNIPRIDVAEETTSNFLSLDIPFTSNQKIHTGDVVSYTNAHEQIMVYAFAGNDTVSVNLKLPQGVASQDLESNPRLRQKYLTILKDMAKQFGLNPPTVDQGSVYSGLLQMTDRVMMGNIVFIGDTLRRVDAISGTGANSAIVDGFLIGQYFLDVRNRGADFARRNLIENLSENTRKAFEFSLFFRELAEMGLSSPRDLERAQSLGLNGRGFGETGLDLVKSAYAGLFKRIVGAENQAAIIRFGLRAFGGPPMPFESEARARQIGEVHPLGGTELESGLLEYGDNHESANSATKIPQNFCTIREM